MMINKIIKKNPNIPLHEVAMNISFGLEGQKWFDKSISSYRSSRFSSEELTRPDIISIWKWANEHLCACTVLLRIYEVSVKLVFK